MYSFNLGRGCDRVYFQISLASLSPDLERVSFYGISTGLFAWILGVNFMKIFCAHKSQGNDPVQEYVYANPIDCYCSFEFTIDSTIMWQSNKAK